MKILVPIDGSRASLAALRHALALRRAGLRASLLLVNVQEPAPLYELLRIHDAEAIAGMVESAGEHLLQDAVAACRAEGAEFEAQVLSGEPAAMLLEAAQAQGCDAIVLGAHGRDDSAGARFGSVAHAVLHDAAVPVSVVRED